ncbi:MAG: DUF459 domain-containing protein [Proteobacteria bacterium]|nr:DUF459 domain-containing protein [Pseudomonadota bacterium]
MRALLAIVLILAWSLFAPTGEVRAQTGGEQASFLDPFPDGDRYRVEVWGDQMADGLLDGLTELMTDEPKFQLDKKLRSISGLTRIDIDQELRNLEAGVTASKPHIVVLMLGAADRSPLRRNNRRVNVGSDDWKQEYALRLDAIMRALRKRSIGVFWVGLPVMRRQEVNDDAEMINELVRSRSLANGVRFVDIFASFAEADKSFTAQGADLTGKMRLLRDSDGVYFTAAGYKKLAYFVERELKRAATQAWDERTIPLAGAEAEQARIRPPTTVKVGPLAAQTAQAAKRPGPGSGPGGLRPPTARSGETVTADDVKAETSRITIKNIGPDGREESTTVEILRPAIPASLVALITRRQSADKPTNVGDPVMTEILGGLTVVSSVTPLAESSAERRRDSSSPLARVLQRGEALPPKPGRADEMPWPRPEPELDPRLSSLSSAAIQGPGEAMPAAPGEQPLPMKRRNRRIERN